jgi:diadenosine tetraphosphatase ApaH/serine/threonine PP2A family protein phosphatase
MLQGFAGPRPHAAGGLTPGETARRLKCLSPQGFEAAIPCTPTVEAARSVKRALISDIHSNLEALEAVLADIKQQGIRQIYCLGDIIGYGPNPRECIDLVIPCDVCLLGNHDQGALFDPEGFNTGAERAIFWTRDQLESGRGDPDDNARRWEFLGELPRNRRENGFLFVHGSARNPLNEYVFPEDIYNHRKMEKIFALIENHCFQGHTHVPGVFTQSLNFLSPEEINYEYQLGEERTMINVGSVGQPRDGDPRACYVVLDDGEGDAKGELQTRCTARFRRVEYPFDKTIQKIYDIQELDNFLGDRLREGR